MEYLHTSHIIKTGCGQAADRDTAMGITREPQRSIPPTGQSPRNLEDVQVIDQPAARARECDKSRPHRVPAQFCIRIRTR